MNDEPGDMLHGDAPLAARAAWLYHAGGLTQAEVARTLGITGARAHRLLARAARDGTVRVLVDGPIQGCMELEAALATAYGLETCRVVPGLGESGLPLRALGQAGAAYLRGALEGMERGSVVGVGHGRSLAACVRYLPRTEAPGGLRLVSLLGGLPRLRAANSYEMAHLLAERTGAEAWLVPVPFFANSAADREVLLAQRGVREAFALAREAALCLAGIGEVGGDAFLRRAEAVTEADEAALLRAGARGELLGRYFDGAGRLLDVPVHARVVAAPLTGLRGLVAIAGGASKAAAIAAVLRARVLHGLITDEPTARSLLAAAPPGPDGSRKGPRNDPGRHRDERNTEKEGTSCTRKRGTPRKASSRGALAGAS